MNKNEGFTLIEVMIALVILAISLATIVKVTNQSVYNLSYVQNKTVAHWVELNVLADMHAGRIADIHSGSRHTGTEQMLANTWQWQLELNAVAESPEILQANIAVYLSGHDRPIEQLTDYIQDMTTP